MRLRLDVLDLVTLLMIAAVVALSLGLWMVA